MGELPITLLVTISAHDSEGRGWITFDGKEVVNFCTLSAWQREYELDETRANIGSPRDHRTLVTARWAEGFYTLPEYQDIASGIPQHVDRVCVGVGRSVDTGACDTRQATREAAIADAWLSLKIPSARDTILRIQVLRGERGSTDSLTRISPYRWSLLLWPPGEHLAPIEGNSNYELGGDQRGVDSY